MTATPLPRARSSSSAGGSLALGVTPPRRVEPEILSPAPRRGPPARGAREGTPRSPPAREPPGGGPGGEAREPREPLPRTGAEGVGNLAMPRCDRDPHGSASSLSPCGDDAVELRFRGPRGPLPGELLGERSGATPQPRHERGIGGQLEHSVRQRPHIAVRYEEPGLALSHRFAQPGAVGGERGRATRRRLDVRDAPPLLRTGQHDGPGAAEQPAFLLL